MAVSGQLTSYILIDCEVHIFIITTTDEHQLV
jgi:hypothetical protein